GDVGEARDPVAPGDPGGAGFEEEGLARKNAREVRGQESADSSEVVHDPRDAGNRGAQEVAFRLDRAQQSAREVLGLSAGAAVPGVVGDRDEKVRAEAAHLVAGERGIEDLVTDTDAGLDLAVVEDRGLRRRRERADLRGDLPREEEELRQRNVFAEGNEVDLPVGFADEAARAREAGDVEVASVRHLLDVVEEHSPARPRSDTLEVLPNPLP